MGSHLPRTPQPAITRLRPRKWGSLSFRSDCLITYPVSRHPKHAECRSVPTHPGCPRRTRLLAVVARPRSSAATWGLVVGGRGLPGAGAQVFPAGSLPGPPRKGVAKRHGSRGGGRLSPGNGTQPPGFWQTLPAAASCGLTNPVVSAAPAAAWRPQVTPLRRSPAAFLQPRLAGEPSRGVGGGCQHTEQGVFGSFRAGRPDHQLHSARSGERTAPVARLSLPPLPLSGRWCHWEETARNVPRRRKRSRKGGGGAGSSIRARGRVSSRRGSRVGDNFSGARAAGRASRDERESAARAGPRGSGGSREEPRPVPCAAAAAARSLWGRGPRRRGSGL